MQVSVGVMSLITLVIVVLASRQVFGGTGTEDFDNPQILWSLIVLLAIFVVIQILCLFSYQFRPGKIGFYVFHIGLVAVLAGSLIYHVTGIKIAGTFYVNAEGSSSDAQVQMIKSNLLKGEDYTANFNSFYFGVTDFTVEYYEPVYDVYRILDAEGKETERILSDVEINSQGVYDFGEYGTRTEEEMMVDGDHTIVYFADHIAAVPRSSVRYYGGDVTLIDLDNGREVTQEVIEVNKPLRINGWKIYLMGYEETYHAASFVFKYDPAESIQLVGYWMLIVGAFLMVLIRPKGKDGDAV